MLSVPAFTSFFDDLAKASLIPSTTFPFLRRLEVEVEAAAPLAATPAAPPEALTAAAPDA